MKSEQEIRKHVLEGALENAYASRVAHEVTERTLQRLLIVETSRREEIQNGIAESQRDLRMDEQQIGVIKDELAKLDGKVVSESK